MKHLAGETDADLIEAIRRGDRTSFAALVQRYQSLVYAIAYAQTGSVMDSQEIAQETFMAAWRQLSKLEKPESVRAWLRVTARNLSALHWRSHARDRQGRGDLLLPQGELASEDPSPLDRIIERQDSQALRQALRRIPEKYRIPLVLYYQEGRSVERVARELDLTKDNVKWRLSEGRRMLHGRLTAFMETALLRSRPGALFTASAMASLSFAHPRETKAAAHRGAPGRIRERLFSLASPSLAAAAFVALLTSATLYASALGRSGARGKTPASTEALLARAPSASVAMAAPVFVVRSEVEDAHGLDVGKPLVDLSLSAVTFDFEDGNVPDLFNQGYVAGCPPRAGNRHCLVATLLPWWGRATGVYLGFHRSEAGTLFRCAPEAAISFDFWIDSVGPCDAQSCFVTLEVQNMKTEINYFARIANSVRKSWVHAAVNLGDLRPESSGLFPVPMETDSPLIATYLTGGRVGSPLFVDNIVFSGCTR